VGLEDRSETLVIAAGDHRLAFHAPGIHGDARSRVDVKAGPFAGSFETHCYASPWQDVHRDLQKLSRFLSGDVKLYGYEEIDLIFTGDGLGHVQAKVDIREYSLRLSFQIELDQTMLPGIIAGIERVFL
jgi:hypothetical protein